MAVRLQRLRVAEQALPEIREWLSDAAAPTILRTHRELGLWVEQIFLGESDGRWYVYIYSEADDPATLSERASAIESPRFVQIRERFRAWFDNAREIPFGASVIVDRSS
jgi:hypothetical protein